jgi:hypothetical protein
MKQSMIPGVAIMAMILTTVGAQAQQPAEGAHSLIEGTWALQFAIADNLTLGEFAGGVISPNTPVPTAALCGTD